MKDQSTTDSYDIIRRPIITEKAIVLFSEDKVAFSVIIGRLIIS